MRRGRYFTGKEWIKYYIDNIKINITILERYGRSEFIKSSEAKEFISKAIPILKQAVLLLEREYNETENIVIIDKEDEIND